MDFHNLKRRELQALCRKHQIPANLTNLEMAKRLTALSAVDEKRRRPLTRGHRSCLKSADEIASGNESDLEARPAKKVKFSPDNETIEFEKSAVRYSQVNVGRRGKSAMSGDKGAEKVNEEVSEPGVSGSGKFGKGGKRGKKVDASKSSEVVADRATRRAKRRLLMAGIGVEGTKVEVIEDKGTITSDVVDGGDKEAGTGKSPEEITPGIRGKKTAKADSVEDTIQNVENEDTKPKRGRPRKKGRTLGEILVASETGKSSEAGTGKSPEENAPGIKGKKTAKADSVEDTTQNVENEDTKPKRGRPRKKGRTLGGMLVAGETGKITARVEASEDKELVDDGLNENAKQVRRSRRGKSPEEVQIEDQAGKRTVIVEALKGNGLVDDGVTGEIKRVTRSRRGKSLEGVQVEGKAGNRATKVEVVDDGAIGDVKGGRRSMRGKSPEGMQVDSKPANIVTTNKALKSKGVVIDGSNEEPKEVRKSVKGKSSKGAVEELAKDAVIDKGLIDTRLDAKDVRQARRGKSAAARQVESKEENKVAKDEGLRDKGPVDDGLHGDATEVGRSRQGKSAEGVQAESKAVKKLRKGEALKDKGRVDGGLVGDAKVVRRSRRGKAPEGMQVETKTGKKVMENEALSAKVVRSSRRGKSPERLHSESKAGKKVTKDEPRGKSPKVNKVTMDDSIKDMDLVGGLSGDAREARRISRKRNFTAGSGVSEAKPSADVPSENIQNEEHIEVKKLLLSKREASTEESEQNGGVRKRSKKSSNVRSQRSGKEEDCEAASESKEFSMEVAGVQLEAGVRSGHAHAVVVERLPLSENATKSKVVQHNMSSSKVTEVKEISGVDKSKIVDVKECSPAESKLRWSQRSASKLELSMQSTAAATIQNSKAETRKKGGAVLEFEEGIRSIRNTEAENSSIADIPADLEAEAASVEGPAKINIEDEDTSHVDIPLDLEGQDVLAEDPMGRNIEVEDAFNVGISAVFDAQAGLAEDPKRDNIEVDDTSSVDILDTQAALPEDPSRVNIEAEDTSNADLDAQGALKEDPDIPADVGARAASVGDPTKASISAEYTSNVEVKNISNADFCADVDAEAEAAAIEAQTNSVCDIVAQLSANPPQFESTIVEVEDTSNVNTRADVEAAAVEARTDSVCDYGRDAQLSADLPQFESTISADSNILVEGQGLASCREERYEANDSLATHIRTPLMAEDCDNTNLECVGELDEQPEDVSPMANSEAHSHEDINEGHDSHTTLIRALLKVGRDCSDGNSELVIDESVMQPEGVLESRNSEAHSDEETAEVNDSQTKNIRTPSTAENNGVDGSLELTDELDKHLETAIESPNSEPLSQTTPLTAGNSALIIVDSHAQNEAVLKSRNSDTHSHEERAEGNDSRTKKIGTPSTAENVCADGDLVLADDLDHHETANESISEADSHKGNDIQTKHIGTPLTEEKDSGDGNLELGVDYLDEQHETVLESIYYEAQSNEERYDGNDSQTTHTGIPLIEEKDCVSQREEVSPIKLNSCGAHYSSTITNVCNPDVSSFKDTKADEIKSSKMAAENSEKLLEHKSPEAIERSASKILLDRVDSCRKHIAHSSGIQGDKLYYTELTAEGVETETKLSVSVFDSETMESAQTSPSLGLNGKAAMEASKIVDLETNLVMSALSPSEHNKGVQPNLDQGMHAAKANEHEDFGHSLESHEEMNSHYESNTDARTSTCRTQDLVEEPIAACDTQSVVFSPGSEGTHKGYGVCSEANIKDGNISVEAVFTTNTPSSGGDAGIVEGTVSMDRSFDVEANALDDQPALRMEGDASCQEETSECKDSKTTPFTAENDHVECSLYQVNNELDKQHAAVGETTSSETHSTSPCEIREEERLLQNSEGKERTQPNLESLKYSKPENSEILINTYDVGSSYNFNDGQAEAMMQTTLNDNESKQEEDTTILPQPAEVLPVQMNSYGSSASLKNYEMDSLEDLKPVKCDSSEILDTVGRSTSINELQGDIRYPSNMQGEVLAFNEQPAKLVGIASEFSGNADGSGTESFRNSYSLDWDGFEAEFNTGVHGFSFGSYIPPEDCEEGYRYPLDHAIVPEEEQGTFLFETQINEHQLNTYEAVSNYQAPDSTDPLDHAIVPEEEQGTFLFETQVNEHQLNTYEAVSNYQAPDSTEASVSMHYPLFSGSEDAELLSERRPDNQNCTSQQELDQDLLETAAGSTLEMEAHQCTRDADEALDHNLVLNLKSDSTLGNSLGGAASESISSAAIQQDLLETAAGSILETEAHQCTGDADEALDHNLVLNLKSDSTLGNSLGGAASESINSAAIQAQKSRNARSILIHGTPKRQPATAHPKGNASVSKVDKVGSLTSVRTAKPPPSARKPWR